MPAPGNATLTNPVKERMQAGEVALGLNVRIARSGDIARIARTTGHDFIFERQVELIRKGVRFVTTQTDIGFLLAAASRWTGDLRNALAQPAR